MRRVIYKLNFTEQEKQQIALIIHNKKYKQLYFTIKLLIVMLSLLLPIAYLFLVKQESFLPFSIIKLAQKSHIFFYQSVWLSHFLAFFLIIPFFSLLLLHIFSGFCPEFSIFTTLNSFWLNLCSTKKLINNPSYGTADLKEKIWYIERKFLAKTSIALLISTLVLGILIYFDTHNYSVITETGWHQRSYGTFYKVIHPWEEVKDVKISCDYEVPGYSHDVGHERQWHYIINFADNQKIDLLSYNTLRIKANQLGCINNLIVAKNIPLKLDIYGACTLPNAVKNCEERLKSLYPSSYKKMKEILMINAKIECDLH